MTPASAPPPRAGGRATEWRPAGGGRTGRNESGIAFVGVVLVLLALLAAPIVLIWRYPDRIEQVVGGWLLLFLSFIAALFYTLFRKKGS